VLQEPFDRLYQYVNKDRRPLQLKYDIINIDWSITDNPFQSSSTGSRLVLRNLEG